MSSTPIRVGIIGLSSSATTSWAADAHLPCFDTAAGRERYQIVALCNSSVAAAQAAIKTYNLPPDTKAYGSPADLAADPDVELVLVNTRVDKHFETTLPSLKAGKDVYIEWPIASNAADIDRLVVAARRSGSRALVGLQGRWAPPVLKLKELLDRSEELGLGRLLSSEVRAYGGTRDREILPVGLKYFAERAVGGNPITIGVGHVIDYVQSVVGELVPGSVHTHLQLQRPEVRVRDPAQNDRIVDTIRSDVPDLLSLHGTVTSSRTHNQPASLIFTFRRGQPFPGTPAFTWTLHCTAGEIRLVAPSGISLQADGAQDVTIQLHRFDSDTVEEVPWGWDERQRQVPLRARSVQTVLYAYADAKRKGFGKDEGRDGWVELEDAAVRAAQIAGWLDGFQA
ncbi:putative oxidoreductase [Chaetomium strumarium]|uniref:Oxidoreductase n=1 Tax=Chaetomium strumarium TaxID=1170767 RepID=A0AAJ0M212_9PEZI|nr:putative oxidoreductase [Chaetomium strumarium]